MGTLVVASRAVPPSFPFAREKDHPPGSGPADNHCKLPRICSAFRSLTQTDSFSRRTISTIPFRFHGKPVCRSSVFPDAFLMYIQYCERPTETTSSLVILLSSFIMFQRLWEQLRLLVLPLQTALASRFTFTNSFLLFSSIHNWEKKLIQT